MMNAKAQALGLHDTQFKNPHGLDADGHYSSAYDLATHGPLRLCRIRSSTSLSNTRHWNADGFDLWNLNKLLPAYPGADGVKPGFTDNAGRCLVGLGGPRQSSGVRDRPAQRRHDSGCPSAARLRVRQLPLAVREPRLLTPRARFADGTPFPRHRRALGLHRRCRRRVWCARSARSSCPPIGLAVWETAARYQMYHALGLLVVAYLAAQKTAGLARLERLAVRGRHDPVQRQPVRPDADRDH